MIEMSAAQLICLYLIGWIPMIFIGMFINNYQWKRTYKNGIQSAFRRGWDAGFGYLQKISDARTERMSGVTIHAEKVSNDS